MGGLTDADSQVRAAGGDALRALLRVLPLLAQPEADADTGIGDDADGDSEGDGAENPAARSAAAESARLAAKRLAPPGLSGAHAERLRAESWLVLALLDGRSLAASGLASPGLAAASPGPAGLDGARLGAAPSASPLLPLRRYQAEGVAWLRFLRVVGCHGILADEMGLGKTAQALVAIAEARAELVAQVADRALPTAAAVQALPPSLVVCPASLTGHWAAEAFRIFGDSLRVLVVIGPPAKRRALLLEGARDAAVIVVSYQTLRSDIELLRTAPQGTHAAAAGAGAGAASSGAGRWLYAVLDEAHSIANPASVVSLAARRLRASHRLALTGTPVQNRPADLWSLFDWLMPSFLGDARYFHARFGKRVLGARDSGFGTEADLKCKEALSELHATSLPFLLRRRKGEPGVAAELPPKTITDVLLPPSDAQRKLFDAFGASEARAAVERAANAADARAGGGAAGGSARGGEGGVDRGGGGSASTARVHVLGALAHLRRVCNSPRLALDAAAARKGPGNGAACSAAAAAAAAASTESGEAEELLLRSLEQSPKLGALRDLLVDAIGPRAQAAAGVVSTVDSEGGGAHRVLVFAQSLATLDCIETELLWPLLPQVRYARLDGRTPAAQRAALALTFNEDVSIDVLLLTTGVGGLGLCLTGANIVVMYDHDWNPSRDAQAMDRAHRLGQTRPVCVYRLLIAGSLEERVMGLQRFKARVAAALTDENGAASSMRPADVLSLLELEHTHSRPTGTAAARARGGRGGAAGGGLSAVLAELDEQQDNEYDELLDAVG
ncbi:SNF2 family N-terminal domain-containing protein [Pavlovales sp. CCMP2436]|nr:SNF2 family N-terminal domain-containing protein [Pavlovales sp. CCMP2436]